MEIDVASIGTTEHNPTTTPTLTFCRQELPLGPTPSSDRKRKKSESSSSTALKSILRDRSALASGSSSFSQKLRRKRAVKFTLEDKPEEPHKWSDKRLRYLALDLDKWDNLPHSALRTLNKQKTRHTKRLKCCHSNENLWEGTTPRPEVDDGASLKFSVTDKKDSENRSLLVADSVPEMESIEKSLFVSRWLQQNSRAMRTDRHQHNIRSSSNNNPGTTLSTFTFSASNRATGSASLGVPAVSVSLRVSPTSADPAAPVPGPPMSPVPPGAASSLQSLASNFHILSLTSSYCRQE